ncbi:MAG: DUF2971 domain-containing protein [Candidatus Aminicenantes bacterium]|nr:MAG: DUF2971 domain-containing protein [Candidatus Aminicenantes bacterium]
MKLYKFRSLCGQKALKNALDIIENERLYCSDYKKLNDPFEGLFYIIFYPQFRKAFSPAFQTEENKKSVNDLSENNAESWTKIVDESKICSLSKTRHDVRMWSLYADSCRGIAIEIDFPDCTSGFLEVNYEKTLMEYDANVMPHLTPEKIFSFKTKHWKYEDEYRVVQNEEYYQIKENKGRIICIYLGVLIKACHKEKILKLVSGKDNKIPVYSTKLNKKDIKIVRNELLN